MLTKKRYIINLSIATLVLVIGLFVAVFGTAFDFNKIVCAIGLISFMLGCFSLAILSIHDYKAQK